MARPKKDTVDFFSHPVKNGTRMFIMEQTYGDKGYVAYYKMLELLGATPGHFLDFNQDKVKLFYAASIRADVELTIKIIDSLAGVEAIDKELWLTKKIVWSSEFVEKLSHLYDKRGGNMPLRPGNDTLNDQTGTETPHSIVTYSKEKNSNLKKLNEKHEYEKVLLVKSEKFVNQWNRWLGYRDEIKKPYKSFSSMRLQILELNKFSDEIAIEMINQSIRQSWQGIFELKNNNNNGTTGKTGTDFKSGGPGVL